MKSPVVIGIAAGIAGGVAASVVTALLASRPVTNATADDSLKEDRLAALETQIARLADHLRDGPPALAEPSRFSPSDLDAAIDRGIARAQREQTVATRGTTDASDETDDPESSPADLAEIIAQLNDPQLSRAKADELWQRLADKGLLDDAIARLAEMAEQDPSNPELQTRLGQAYIEKLKRTDGAIQQGMLAMTADQAFDQALKADPEHWDARFMKAVSLSFWPPITGKAPEAVSNFEVLLAQQEKSGVLKPEYAATYLLLGNLYLQQGKTDLAQSVYNKGYGLFPNDPALKKQLDSLP